MASSAASLLTFSRTSLKARPVAGRFPISKSNQQADDASSMLTGKSAVGTGKRQSAWHVRPAFGCREVIVFQTFAKPGEPNGSQAGEARVSACKAAAVL